jgi:hypothetical protein
VGRPGLALIVFCALLTGAIHAAISLEGTDVQIGGFFSQDYLYSNNNNYPTADKGGTWDFREMAFNASTTFGSHLRVGAQVSEVTQSTAGHADQSATGARELMHQKASLRETVDQLNIFVGLHASTLATVSDREVTGSPRPTPRIHGRPVPVVRPSSQPARRLAAATFRQ